ncbi:MULTISPECIES: hypothetical protein [Streptomyces]|uniref:Uncharacterized protein n=1 Tax=Streptomyces liliiviolaceus TaxID=2823109 RepID=A0A940Y2S8_9ACTN|nr:hypothetical protein [Streptomyces liliiviolaceus]MBQ0854596.1 hypothetical protein [Streptomyces liliiviolaceus]
MTHTPVAARRAHREPGEVFGSGFSLFADMLYISLLTSIACLPVVTAPAAFAAASATLRTAAGEGTPATFGGYLREVRAHVSVRTLLAGLTLPLLAAVVTVDAALARSALPGARVVAPALALFVLGAAVVVLRAGALDAPHRLSVREGLVRSVADPRGSLLLTGAVLLAVVIAWSIPLLVPLLPGPLAFAATVVVLRAPADRIPADRIPAD